MARRYKKRKKRRYKRKKYRKKRYRKKRYKKRRYKRKRRRKKKRNYKKGVPSGYKHHWKYKGRWSETKNKDGSWNFSFRATKGKRAKRYGKFKKGFKILWKLDGYQTAIKTGKGKYQTRFYGRKKRVKSGYKL